MRLLGEPSRRELLASGAALFATVSSSQIDAVPVPRQEIGVNMYDLFMVWLWGGDIRISPPKLATLGQLGIPFVRFPASGQFAEHWRRLERDPKSWWSTMDTLFVAAEHNGVMLVPSIFWEPASLSLYLGEPVRAWGNATSRTRRFARAYANAFVRRYRHSPAVLMWEFGNEMNIWADWPRSIEWWPRADPSVTHINSLDDAVTSSAVLAAFTDFAEIVCKLDPRSVQTGGDLPRADAWHRAHQAAGRDSRAQFIENLQAITPKICRAMSVHLYPARYGGPDNIFSNPKQLLEAFQEAAAESGREAFLGELGVPSIPAETAGSSGERRKFQDILDAIRASDIRYAAVWDYDRTKPDAAFNIRYDNARAYQLDAIIQINRETAR
ncbi:hypothetical protein [Sphingomonas faeni]|uniref:hypothetical protein n=1 Tax=Sphingomonas faeni TaxID=185950 RepID=UPI0033450EB9